MSITALSSRRLGAPWTSVSPQAKTSRTARSLPNIARAASAPCDAMSRSAPPPASSAPPTAAPRGRLGGPGRRGVGPAVAVACAEGGETPDRAGLDDLPHPDHLGVEDDV